MLKAMFGVVGLVVVLAIVGLLVKRQSGVIAPQNATSTAGQTVDMPTGTPRNQVEQVKQTVEQLTQQPRAMPDKE